MIRVGGPRVRTGCLVCKKRHIKCDEARPSCGQCTKTGRACTPSDKALPKLFEKVIVYTPPCPPSQVPQCGPVQKRAFEYFRSRAALDFCGHFESELWSAYILKLAVHDDAVRHAAVALSSMHEIFSQPEASLRQMTQVALNHYGRAMREVTRPAYLQKQGPVLVLVICLLFAAFESLQGHYYAAITHARAGLRILVQAVPICQSQGDSNRLFKMLARSFLLMDTQITELCDSASLPSITDLLGPQSTPPAVFSGLEEALTSLELFKSEIIKFAITYYDLLADPTAPAQRRQEVMDEYQQLKDYLGLWEDAVDLMPQRNLEDTADEQFSAYTVVSLQRIPARVMLEQAVPQPEICYEEVLCDSDMVVEKLEKLLGGQSAVGSSAAAPGNGFGRTFSMATGILPALYILSSKTGHRQTREKALNLLKTCHRREGMFDSQLIARLVELEVAIREEYSDSATFSDLEFMPGRKCVLKYSVSKPGTGQFQEMIEELEWSR